MEPKIKRHTSLFDVGNSNDGPIGMVARVRGADPEDALMILRASLADTFPLFLEDANFLYVNVYLNADNITLRDFVEVELDDEDQGG